MSDANSKSSPTHHDPKAGVVRVLPVARKGKALRASHDVPLDVLDSVGILERTCGENLIAIIFFGSRLLDTSPNADSAADLFVVVEDYTRFYQDIGSRLPQARRASIMAWLNRVLPPNIIYLRDPGDLRAGAKCFVINRRALDDAMAPQSPDHFCRGRLTQRVQVVYARNGEESDRLEDLFESARRHTLDWVQCYLEDTFTVLQYCRRMLEVSYVSEIRPESRSRVHEVFDAQRTYFQLAFDRILEEAADQGKLNRVEGGYELPHPPKLPVRLAVRWFFQRSRLRAFARWFKYMLTFDDWLDYIVRKAERRTGVHLELTPAERKFPVVLLWPKAFKVIRAMRGKGPQATNGKSSHSRNTRGDR